MVHRHLVQVRSTDLDWIGHVNNTAFPVFFQEARVALQHGWRGSLRHDEVDTVMARLEVDHVAQLHLRDEPVAVDTVVERLGRTSFTYAHQVRDPDSGVVFARGRSVMVVIDRESGRPVPLLQSLRDYLAQFADGPAT
jgi:acyl-CoA thioester hydrolase